MKPIGEPVKSIRKTNQDTCHIFDLKIESSVVFDTEDINLELG